MCINLRSVWAAIFRPMSDLVPQLKVHEYSIRLYEVCKDLSLAQSPHLGQQNAGNFQTGWTGRVKATLTGWADKKKLSRQTGLI